MRFLNTVRLWTWHAIFEDLCHNNSAITKKTEKRNNTQYNMVGSGKQTVVLDRGSANTSTATKGADKHLDRGSANTIIVTKVSGLVTVFAIGCVLITAPSGTVGCAAFSIPTVKPSNCKSLSA